MQTVLFLDQGRGTEIVFDGIETVTITVAHVPFSKLTMELDLDDVDRLLAVVEHSITPTTDLGEFFQSVYSCQERPAQRAAAAFVTAAPGLAETLR